MQRVAANIVLVAGFVVALFLSSFTCIPDVPIFSGAVGIALAKAADDQAGAIKADDTETTGESTVAIGPSESTSSLFNDISPADWFYDKVTTLTSSDIISGYPDGSFRPGAPAARAEMATFLTRAKGLMYEGGEPFDDVHRTDWFYSGVAAIYNAGLMNGTAQQRFSPSQLLTREQAAAIIARASGVAGVSDTKEQELWLQGLKDRRSINNWARPYVATAIKYGLMAGYPNQDFRPAAPVNRAEVCALVWNLLNESAKPRDTYPEPVVTYPLIPEIASPLTNKVIYDSNYKLTVRIDPESTIQELWINGKLADVKYTNLASTVTFSDVNVAEQLFYVGVTSKNASGSAHSGTLTLYHFNASPDYERLIVIDKSEFKLYWIVGGFVKKVYPIAIGKDGTPTPAAKWIVGEKLVENPKGVFGPRRLRLYRFNNAKYQRTGYGVHGTDEPWVIGTKASHGCIRLKNEDILELWPQVNIGDYVITQQ